MAPEKTATPVSKIRNRDRDAPPRKVGITWEIYPPARPKIYPAFAVLAGLSRRVAQGMASFGGRLWMYGGEGEFGEDDSHDMLWSLDGTGWRHRYYNQIEVP